MVCAVAAENQPSAVTRRVAEENRMMKVDYPDSRVGIGRLGWTGGEVKVR